MWEHAVQWWLYVMVGYAATGLAISFRPIPEVRSVLETAGQKLRHRIAWATLWPIGVVGIWHARHSDASRKEELAKSNERIAAFNIEFEERLQKFRESLGNYEWRAANVSPEVNEELGQEVMLKERLPDSDSFWPLSLGDEVWCFTTHPESWWMGAGRAGRALVRAGCVSKIKITRMN